MALLPKSGATLRATTPSWSYAPLPSGLFQLLAFTCFSFSSFHDPKIASREIPADIIAEGRDWIAFRDITPQAHVHLRGRSETLSAT